MPKNLKGGGEKIDNIILQLFSKRKIEFLPLSSIFINNISAKYVNMVSLNEFRKIIDTNEYLKQSEILMNIYKNNYIISLNDIYNNIEITMLNNSLEDNVKILFQYILDYNVNRYSRKDTDIYSIITCNELYDDAYETEVNMKLLNKMFDIRDLEELINETKDTILYDDVFRELVEEKMKKCSEKPYSIMDLFTGEISFNSNKKCDLPSNKLIRLNGDNLLFLSENMNSLTYGDKMKLLILYEHRLTLLSRYFSLEVLRRKNSSKTIIMNLLNKILKLDIPQNRRKLTKTLLTRNKINIPDNINNNDNVPYLQSGGDENDPPTPNVSPPPVEEQVDNPPPQPEEQVGNPLVDNMQTEEQGVTPPAENPQADIPKDEGQVVNPNITEESAQSSPPAPPSPVLAPAPAFNFSAPPSSGLATPGEATPAEATPGEATPGEVTPAFTPELDNSQPQADGQKEQKFDSIFSDSNVVSDKEELPQESSDENKESQSKEEKSSFFNIFNPDEGLKTDEEKKDDDEEKKDDDEDKKDNEEKDDEEKKDDDGEENGDDEDKKDIDLELTTPSEPIHRVDMNMIENMIDKKINEIFDTDKIINIIDKEFKNIYDKYELEDVDMSYTDRLVRSDNCANLKQNIINNNVDVNPNMMNMLSNCNNTDILSGLNHRERNINNVNKFF